MRRVQEILEYLVGLLVNEQGIDEQSIVRKLLDDGYGFEEIEQAFSHLMDLFTEDTTETELKTDCGISFRRGALAPPPRVLTPEEAGRFGVEAHAKLVRMQSKGLLSPEEVDRVVAACERAQLDPVEASELDLVISHVCDCGFQVIDLDGPQRARHLN